MAEAAVHEVNLLHIFKNGVEENVALLAHMSENQKKEAWRFWLQVTETVKQMTSVVTTCPVEGVTSLDTAYSGDKMNISSNDFIIKSDNCDSYVVKNYSHSAVTDFGNTMQNSRNINLNSKTVLHSQSAGTSDSIQTKVTSSLIAADDKNDHHLPKRNVKRSTSKKSPITFVDVSAKHQQQQHTSQTDSQDAVITVDRGCCGGGDGHGKASIPEFDNSYNSSKEVDAAEDNITQPVTMTTEGKNGDPGGVIMEDHHGETHGNKEIMDSGVHDNDAIVILAVNHETEENTPSPVKRLRDRPEKDINHENKRSKLLKKPTLKKTESPVKRVRKNNQSTQRKSHAHTENTQQSRRLSPRSPKPNKMYVGCTGLFKPHKTAAAASKNETSTKSRATSGSSPAEDSNQRNSTRRKSVKTRSKGSSNVTPAQRPAGGDNLPVSSDDAVKHSEVDSKSKKTEMDKERFQRDVDALIERTVSDESTANKVVPETVLNDSTAEKVVPETITNESTADKEETEETSDHEDGDEEKKDEESYKGLSLNKKKTSAEVYKCNICSSVLSNGSNLKVHMRRHNGEKPFQCPICGRKFTTKPNMVRHERTHFGEKPYECPDCHQCFTEKKSMMVHRRLHTGERPYKCIVCEKTFVQLSTFNSHVHMHLGVKEHSCDLCGKKFRQKSQLRVHLDRHKGIRKFTCSTCHKKFISKGDLERHVWTHTGYRPFECETCGQTFTRLQYLKEHINLHTGEKPYQCTVCSQRFSERSSCRRHIKLHHQEKEDLPAKTSPPKTYVVYLNASDMLETPDESEEAVQAVQFLQPMTLDEASAITMATVDESVQQQGELVHGEFSAISLLATEQELTTEVVMDPCDSDNSQKQMI